MALKRHKRRVLYYTDGRHSHLYQLEPPITLEQLCIPVDEVLGTMVDTFVLCAGGGTTFLHNTKVGTLWGELEEEKGEGVWRHIIWYRTAETVRQLHKQGYDQIQVLADRAHEKGLEFIVSLWTNAPAGNRLGDGRIDRFRRNHPEYQIEFSEARRRRELDFSQKEVREERLRIIDEICRNYPIGGFELNMAFPEVLPFTNYFKPEEAERKSHIMTSFVRDVRRILDAKEEELILAVRIPPTIEICRTLGLDVETWIKEGLLNILAPVSDRLIDVDMPVEEWIRATKGSGCQVYPCIGASVNDDRRIAATVEMYRAAAMNYLNAGVDGIYIVEFYVRGWPFNEEDYTILREVGDIDVIRFKDKHYWVRTGTREDPSILYPRKLPLLLKDGSENSVEFKANDDLEAASKAGTLKMVKLRLRIKNVTPNDRLSFSLNGTPLPEELCRMRDFTYRLLSPARSVERRLGSHYIFEFDLTNKPFPIKGLNNLLVRVEKRNPKIDQAVRLVLHDVELLVCYRIARNYPTFDEEKDF